MSAVYTRIETNKKGITMNKELLNLQALEAELEATLAYFESVDYNVSQREIDFALRLTKAVKALGSTKKW